ncbi:MAG: hypothetical protein LUG61_04390 [Lachnospiraceae bacterium]|nr:hypothetical protein [Lachnospiraceae bacterium]
MDERQQTSMKRKADTVEFYRQQNKSAAQGKIVFAGSSLMEGFPINKLLEEHHGSSTLA